MKKQKNKIILFVLLIIIILVGILLEIYKKEKIKTIKINNCSFAVEVVDDGVGRYRGLSFRDNLEKNSGMLFLFEDKKERTFVMRDMNFPLDIIFISDNRVVNFFENCLPEEKNNLTLYKSLEPVDVVLEVSSGTINRCNIRIEEEVN